MNRATLAVAIAALVAPGPAATQAWEVDSLVDPMSDAPQIWASLRATNTTQVGVLVEVILWCRPADRGRPLTVGIWSSRRPDGIWDGDASMSTTPPEPSLNVRFDTLEAIALVARGRTGSASGYILTPRQRNTGTFALSSEREAAAGDQIIAGLLKAERRLLVQFKLASQQDLTAQFVIRPPLTRAAINRAAAPCGGLAPTEKP
jgi:hypothetical protein